MIGKLVPGQDFLRNALSPPSLSFLHLLLRLFSSLSRPSSSSSPYFQTRWMGVYLFSSSASFTCGGTGGHHPSPLLFLSRKSGKLVIDRWPPFVYPPTPPRPAAYDDATALPLHNTSKLR